jgi:tetratricopeptide (TPR) repeat protein
MAASPLWMVLPHEGGPGDLRRGGYATSAQRRPEAVLHELCLGLTRCPAFDYENAAALGQSGEVCDQPGGPVSLPRFRVDPQFGIDIAVFGFSHTVKFQNQQLSHRVSGSVRQVTAASTTAGDAAASLVREPADRPTLEEFQGCLEDYVDHGRIDADDAPRSREEIQIDCAAALNAAQGLMNIGYFSEALETSEVVLAEAIDPEHFALAKLDRGRALSGLKEYLAAAQELDEAEELLREIDPDHSALASIYIERSVPLSERTDEKSLREALALNLHAVSLMPGSSAAYANVAQIHSASMKLTRQFALCSAL